MEHLMNQEYLELNYLFQKISLNLHQKVLFIYVGFFITKIFHPNVSDKGEICVNTLKKDWNNRNWSLYNILEVP